MKTQAFIFVFIICLAHESYPMQSILNPNPSSAKNYKSLIEMTKEQLLNYATSLSQRIKNNQEERSARVHHNIVPIDNYGNDPRLRILGQITNKLIIQKGKVVKALKNRFNVIIE